LGKFKSNAGSEKELKMLSKVVEEAIEKKMSYVSL